MPHKPTLINDLNTYNRNRNRRGATASTNRRKDQILSAVVQLINTHIDESGAISDPVKFFKDLDAQIDRDILAEGCDKKTLVGKLFDLQRVIYEHLIAIGDAGSLEQIHALLEARSARYAGLDRCDRAKLDRIPVDFRTALEGSNHPAIMELFTKIRLEIARQSFRHNLDLEKVQSFLTRKAKALETNPRRGYTTHDLEKCQKQYNNYLKQNKLTSYTPFKFVTSSPNLFMPAKVTKSPPAKGMELVARPPSLSLQLKEEN